MTLLTSINMIGADFKIDTLTIDSKILSESRMILIFTPTGLKRTDSVSILYMLDGEFSKYRFEKIVDDNLIQIIGIGIINTDRRKDLLQVNQANNFNTFIEKELIPIIESKYLIHERVLFGHSFGGAFTIYSMINKPALFNKYIASSPTPIMNLIDKEIYQKLDELLLTNIKFYLSYGSEDMQQVKKWASRLIKNLQSLKTNRFNWTSQVFEGENHNTSDIISIIKGLRF